MKKLISFMLAICIICLFSVSVSAEEEPFGGLESNGYNSSVSQEVISANESISVADESVESSETSQTAEFEQPDGINYIWLYWVVGIVSVLFVVAAAIFISKKFK